MRRSRRPDVSGRRNAEGLAEEGNRSLNVVEPRGRQGSCASEHLLQGCVLRSQRSHESRLSFRRLTRLRSSKKGRCRSCHRQGRRERHLQYRTGEVAGRTRQELLRDRRRRAEEGRRVARSAVPRLEEPRLILGLRRQDEQEDCHASRSRRDAQASAESERQLTRTGKVLPNPVAVSRPTTRCTGRRHDARARNPRLHRGYAPDDVESHVHAGTSHH